MKKISSILASLLLTTIALLMIDQSTAHAFPASVTNKSLAWWSNSAKQKFGTKSTYQWIITDDSFGAEAAVELINRGLVLKGSGFIALGDLNGGPPRESSTVIHTVGIACNYNPRESAALLEKIAVTSANLGTILVKLCNRPFSDSIVESGKFSIVPNESKIHPGKTGGFIIR